MPPNTAPSALPYILRSSNPTLSRSTRSVAAATRHFTSSPSSSSSSARTAPALPGGRLSASSLRTLIALHHLSHPIRQISLPQTNTKSTAARAQEEEQGTGDSADLDLDSYSTARPTRPTLMPIITHTLRKSTVLESTDASLRALATFRLNPSDSGSTGRMTDRVVRLAPDGSMGGQEKSQGQSFFSAKLNQNGKNAAVSSGSDSDILFHDHSRSPTTAQIVNTAYGPELTWSQRSPSSSSSSSSSFSPPSRSSQNNRTQTNNAKASLAGTRSILHDREARLREALYGVSAGKVEDEFGDAAVAGGGMPDLEAVLEWVGKERR